MGVDDLPDGSYAKWRGHVLRAFPQSGQFVDLRWDGEGEPPEPFDEEGGHLWRRVAQSDLSEYFHLRTYCTWKGERCLVNGVAPNGRIGLYWIPTGKTFDPTPLGFGPTWERGQYSAAAPPEELEDVHQERSDIPLPHLQHGTEQQ